MPHHPRKAYPSRSRGRLTGPVMGKHKTADAPGGARKAWPELYTAGRLFNGEYRKQHLRYRMEAIERTVALSERLQRRDYSFGPYYPFKVYEPKERLVLAIDFEGKIDSTPDPGIPIGNQSSQLLALLYLDAFDHWLRDDRGLVYGRYMDDFYIIHSDKLLLRQILKEIEAYIKPLGLRLNGKTQILPLKNGIDFLGFHTYLTQTGKVVRKVRAKSIDNMKRKIRKFRGLVDSGKMTLDSVVQSYASWTGHISHGNTYHLRQNMDAYFFSYFPELKPSPKGDTTHGPKTEQPRKQVEGQVRQPVRQPDRLDRGR